MFAGSNGLADLGIEIAHLSIDGSFYLQVFHPLAYQGEAALHVTDILVEAADLAFPEKIVLPDAFVNDFQLCPCRFVLFGSQAKLLLRYQLLFDKGGCIARNAVVSQPVPYSGRCVPVSSRRCSCSMLMRVLRNSFS